MLQQMGINANLGPFNIVVRNAGFSFAKQVRGSALTRIGSHHVLFPDVFPIALFMHAPLCACAPNLSAPLPSVHRRRCFMRWCPLATLCPVQDIVPVVGAPIPAGLRIDADMEYLSMPFKFNALVTTDGLSISARVTALPVSLGVLLCHVSCLSNAWGRH